MISGVGCAGAAVGAGVSEGICVCAGGAAGLRGAAVRVGLVRVAATTTGWAPAASPLPSDEAITAAPANPGARIATAMAQLAHRDCVRRRFQRLIKSETHHVIRSRYVCGAAILSSPNGSRGLAGARDARGGPFAPSCARAGASSTVIGQIPVRSSSESAKSEVGGLRLRSLAVARADFVDLAGLGRG